MTAMPDLTGRTPTPCDDCGTTEGTGWSPYAGDGTDNLCESCRKGRTAAPRGLPQTVPCPICKVEAGAACQTRGGRRCHYSHEARKREANRG